MRFPLRIDLGHELCLRCGAIYKVSARDFTYRVVGHFVCPCGNEMNRWRAFRSFSYARTSIDNEDSINPSLLSVGS